MAITVTGTLANPIGTVLQGATIRVTAKSNDHTFVGSVGTLSTGASGTYSFELGSGGYMIEVLQDDEYTVGADVVLPDTTETMSLPALISTYGVS